MREEGSSTIESEAETEAEYQERFQQMAEHIQEIFWMLDAHTKQVLYVSLAYERVCGRACASLYEDPLSYREVIHPDDRDRVLTHREESAGSGCGRMSFASCGPTERYAGCRRARFRSGTGKGASTGWPEWPRT